MSRDPSQFNLNEYFLGADRLCQFSDNTAIEFHDRRLTYGELRAEVERWVRRLENHGVNEGDRVALLLYDSPEFVASFLAVVSLGGICVPINTFLPGDDVAFILADSGARLMIAESELQDKAKDNDAANLDTIVYVDSQTRSLRGDESDGGADAMVLPTAALHKTTRQTPAFLLYTSGSTGTPKGVLHLHGSMPFTVQSYSANVLKLSAEDRIFSSSRMFFAYGLGNSLSFPLAAGATVLLEPKRMDPERLASFIEARKPTVFFGVPAVYLSLLEYRSSGGRIDFSSIRLCVSAGEALPSKIYEDWRREFGFRILDGIGSTEMLHIFISNREENSRAGSTGTIVEGYDARLSDDAGKQVDANQLGNLWVRGGSATTGYWNRPDLTESTIIDGWVRTGDVYRRDEDGYFHHIGRSDDCFKVHGLWVSPIEVESVLVSHDAVSEAAVICAMDERGLATVRAYVVIRQGERSSTHEETLADELRKFAGSRLSHHKVPTHIHIIEEMPRTSTGKIQRYKLREANQGSSGGSDDNSDDKEK